MSRFGCSVLVACWQKDNISFLLVGSSFFYETLSPVPLIAPGVLEKLRVRTIGLKDVLTGGLAGRPLPLELFTKQGLRTKE